MLALIKMIEEQKDTRKEFEIEEKRFGLKINLKNFLKSDKAKIEKIISSNNFTKDEYGGEKDGKKTYSMDIEYAVCRFNEDPEGIMLFYSTFPDQLLPTSAGFYKKEGNLWVKTKDDMVSEEQTGVAEKFGPETIEYQAFDALLNYPKKKEK
jgi:hypothetical protein